jgi:hypothetical protein
LRAPSPKPATVRVTKAIGTVVAKDMATRLAATSAVSEPMIVQVRFDLMKKMRSRRCPSCRSGTGHGKPPRRAVIRLCCKNSSGRSSSVLHRAEMINDSRTAGTAARQAGESILRWFFSGLGGPSVGGLFAFPSQQREEDKAQTSQGDPFGSTPSTSGSSLHREKYSSGKQAADGVRSDAWWRCFRSRLVGQQRDDTEFRWTTVIPARLAGGTLCEDDAVRKRQQEEPCRLAERPDDHRCTLGTGPSLRINAGYSRRRRSAAWERERIHPSPSSVMPQVWGYRCQASNRLEEKAMTAV